MKRWLFGAVGVLALLALAGCDPYAAAAPGTVELDATVHGDGSAAVQLFFDDSSRSTVELRDAGEQVASRLFPAVPAVTVQVDENDHGVPFAVIDADDVYRPGARPQLSLDTRDAVAWLLDHGARSVDVVVTAPHVPFAASWSPVPPTDDASPFWTWREVTVPDGAPAGVLTMAPRPWRGLVPPVAIAAGFGLLAGAVVTARRRRRGTALLLAVAAVGGAVVPMRVVLPFELENLGVAGWLPGAGVTAVSIGTAASLLVLLLAVVVVLGYLLVTGYPWKVVPG